MMQPLAPALKELLLIGGGHAHVHVLKAFAMKPLSGLRLTLISREVHTPYSGMLPGFIAGHYDYDDIHIDLGPLTRLGSVRLVVGTVTGVDPQRQKIFLADHPPFNYDLLSINSGAVPGISEVELHRDVTAVKPIGRFLPSWQRIKLQTLKELSAGRSQTIVLVGGGAGGVELALAIAHSLGNQAGAAQFLSICLVTAGSGLLAGHNPRVTSHLERTLLDQGVTIRYRFQVTRVERCGLIASDGRIQPADHVLWVTGVAAPAWLAASGLDLDPHGFIRVNDRLQSLSHANIFAAGDIASLVGQSRPKSGVFAVREGPLLSENLRRAVLQRPLLRFRAQKRFLSILALGNGKAVASRGAWFASGPWVWRWKDWIDRRFMAKFQGLPEMTRPASRADNRLTEEFPDNPIRCGGCGSKLSSDLLQRVLQRLPPTRHDHVDTGIGDDAAILFSGSKKIVISTDSFRSMIDDPWVFGRVAVQHSLNDVYAMGAEPVAALAIATVPYMAEPLMEQDLYLMMAGAVSILQAEGIALAGGHSAEGAELSLGFAVTGELAQAALTKKGLQPGDALILTRPLGSGVLLAGQMQGRTRSRWVQHALAIMVVSNRRAADCLRRHGVQSCTDISGFGLLGHLGEMCKASTVHAVLHLDDIPFYEGALTTMAPVHTTGVQSSLQTQNERVLRGAEFDNCNAADTRVRLLMDPQTAGGLLAGVPDSHAQGCLMALHELGYREANIIGWIPQKTAAVALQPPGQHWLKITASMAALAEKEPRHAASGRA